MSKSKYDNIGKVIDDFQIVGINNERKYIVKCNICNRSSIVSQMGQITSRNNKHGYICSLILAKEKFNGNIRNNKDKRIKVFQSIWNNLRNRTNNPNYEKWERYGGRGINSDAFEYFVDFYDTMYDSFLEHVEKYGLDNTTIDRIDSNGNYEPSNCRWATWDEQAKNKDRILKFKAISPTGEVIISNNLKLFCEENNLDYAYIYSGIHQHNKSFKKTKWSFQLIDNNLQEV